MRRNTEDETLRRNYIQKWRFLISEYKLVKAKKHSQFKFLEDFYRFHNTHRQTFLKDYNRVALSGDEIDLLPQKRGPKWKSRRTAPEIEEEVVTLRKRGLNRYEICHILKPKLRDNTPSPSCVYNIIKRHNLNRPTPTMKEEKRRIIKEKAGELGHIDAHYLNKDLIVGDTKRRYLVCVVDACTRTAWCEIVDDIKAITVMFATLRCFNIMADRYDIRFAEVLTDNGSEMGSRTAKHREDRPMERLFMELGIKHRYTRPYRPQTNGKVERFWRTIEDDLLRETTFDSREHLEQEVLEYMIYYNEHRPHQGIGGETPKEFNKYCQRIK
jgi:transposase InsO family protein